MKKTAILLAAFLAFVAHADLVARAGKNELRLIESPCRNDTVLALLKPEWREHFQAARAEVNGKVYAACWIDTGQGAYFVMFDDGGTQVFPITIFTQAGA